MQGTPGISAELMPDSPTSNTEPYDVAVIGAGVIGCAVARRFTLEGARVLVIEKASDILDGASKGNSALLHTGFDAPPGSLEAQCIASGYAEYLAVHESLGLPLFKSGALVLAWTEEQEAQLPSLMEKAQQNGVTDVRLLSAAETRHLEPSLASSVRASFQVPREYTIDAWSTPYAYLLQAVQNGAELLRNCELLAGHFAAGEWLLQTSRGEVRCCSVINAAGLYGDEVDQRLLGIKQFHVKPRKGQFIVYDKPAASLFQHILLPVPTKITKGIVVCRTVYGNVLVGPTAEEQEDRCRAELVPDTLRELQSRAMAIMPALADIEVTAMYAGLRPATEFNDYQINTHADVHCVSIGGIRSTGLSSALGTASHVFELSKRFFGSVQSLSEPVCTPVANISEFAPRDWEIPGNGGIVCHCESVTHREIVASLQGPLAPQTLSGLKRRTRVTMGRCQGFYCNAEIVSLQSRTK